MIRDDRNQARAVDFSDISGVMCKRAEKSLPLHHKHNVFNMTFKFFDIWVLQNREEHTP